MIQRGPWLAVNDGARTNAVREAGICRGGHQSSAAVMARSNGFAAYIWSPRLLKSQLSWPHKSPKVNPATASRGTEGQEADPPEVFT
jgi:hypothetical protein